MAGDRMIRASEIGEYVYCRRAWWLHQVVGEDPAGRERREHGITLHARHGRALHASQLLLVCGAGLAIIALVLLVLR